jgi:plastocyanin
MNIYHASIHGKDGTISWHIGTVFLAAPDDATARSHAVAYLAGSQAIFGDVDAHRVALESRTGMMSYGPVGVAILNGDEVIWSTVMVSHKSQGMTYEQAMEPNAILEDLAFKKVEGSGYIYRASEIMKQLQSRPSKGMEHDAEDAAKIIDEMIETNRFAMTDEPCKFTEETTPGFLNTDRYRK